MWGKEESKEYLGGQFQKRKEKTFRQLTRIEHCGEELWKRVFPPLSMLTTGVQKAMLHLAYTILHDALISVG